MGGGRTLRGMHESRRVKRGAKRVGGLGMLLRRESRGGRRRAVVLLGCV